MLPLRQHESFRKQVCSCENVCLKKKSASSTKNKSDFHQVEECVVQRQQQLEDDVYVDEICGLYDVESRVDKFWIVLSVNDSKVRFEVDTGAPVAIMSVADYEKLLPGVKLDKPDLSLVSYSGNSIGLRGMCTVVVQYAGEVYRLLLYVAENRKHPLLGRSWMKVLRLDVSKFYEEVHSVTDNVVKCTTDESVKKLIAQYSSVCDQSMGKIVGLTAKLQLKPNAHPVYIKARPVPFSLRSAVEQEIEKLVNDGVLEKVNHSDWATPVVPVMKMNNKVRLCGDYKITVNRNLVVDEHPLPTVEELFANVAGGEKFSKIDLSQAYLQLEVDAEQRDILTLSTHLGLYRPTRLMYGVSSAPAIWQRLMEEVLNGIPGVTVFLDDIRVTGPNDKVHLQRLEEVLKRLSQYGMRINVDKCVFFANQIEYCGYVVDRHGIHKVKEKIDAVQNMPTPESKEQVRSFVGLVNYYGRFLPNLSTMIHPLNRLLRNDVPFEWSKACEEAFRKVKQEMQSDSFLVHYNPELPLVLATDASPYGVGAVLSHVLPDGSERPIQYASQTLNETQRKYKQVDREAYAIVFGIRRFHQYLYGRKFVLYTDNEPVKQIFSETKGLPTMSALRMQHYATFLQSFDYSIKFRPTKQHYNADAFSRLPIAMKQPNNVVEETDLLEISIIETMPLTVNDLAKETAADSSVKVLLQGLKNGKTVEARDRFGINQNEFSLQQGCILRGIRVYIPPKLRTKVLQELHSTHFGSTRLKSLARGYVWWERIDRDIEELVMNCASCQVTRPNPTKAPLHCWEPATQPFERVHVDFAGPFMGKYFIVFVDAFTKWPEVKILRDITTATTINSCREFFSTYGIPCVLVSDRGVQFTSSEFKRFLELNGVFHKMGAPYHPATNGQVERFIQTFKNKMKALQCDKTKMNVELCNILLTYRKTIHPTTGKSPSMMVFNRQIRSRLDLMLPGPIHSERADPKIRSIPEGGRVAARDFLGHEKWKYGRIVEKLGKLHYMVQLDDNRIWKRHIDQLREVGPNLPVRRSLPDMPILPDVSTQPTIAPNASSSRTVPASQEAPTTANFGATIASPSVQPVLVSASDPSQTLSVPTTNKSSEPFAKSGRSTGLHQQTPRRSTRVVKAPKRLNL
ncbi:uncharacterized protein K02A2.6-like [Armigeres subalbatus]|uniref:uncharacterized protein K02A2.6-like n=1 Tax=Armigeres subalbatus TaxID=124917 RepID=UPI002ED6BB09